MGRATLAETGGERSASAWALFNSWVAREGLTVSRAAKFRIRGKRMLREKAAMKLKNHRKSKDIRKKFAALAQAKYEDNRKKAEAYRKAQSFGDVSPQVAADEAEVVRKAEAEAHLEADLAVREVQADTWTWTLGRSLRDFKPVGRGASGEVFFATFEGLPVAVKLTKGRGLQAAATGIDVQEEFAVLTALGQHPNVVRAFAVVTSSLGRPGLVLERASESLHAKARRLKDDRLENSPAGRASLLGLFSQFVLGLSFVHGRSVMHLDVKPANILVFDDKRAALADFGHAEGVSENGCSVVGDRVYTLDFRCPECLMAGGQKAWVAGVRVKFAADVWAAAATLFEVCCPRKASLFSVPPGTFVRETEEQTAKAIREMATARSFKLMPYDQTMQDILEKTFVPAEKRLSLPGLLRILDKERSASRSIGRYSIDDVFFLWQSRRSAQKEAERKEREEAKKKAEEERKKKQAAYEAQKKEEQRLAVEEKKRKQAEEKLRAEAEQKRKQEEALQKQEAKAREAEERKRQEQEKKDAEAKKRAEEAAQRAEAERLKKEEQEKIAAEQKRKQEEEARQRKEAEELKRQQAEEAKRKQEAEQKQKEEAERQRKEVEARQRQQAEEERKRKEEEERKQKEEQERKQKEEQERKQKEEQERKQREEQERKQREEQERLQKEQERQRQEEESRRKAEEERRKQEQEQKVMAESKPLSEEEKLAAQEKAKQEEQKRYSRLSFKWKMQDESRLKDEVARVKEQVEKREEELRVLLATKVEEEKQYQERQARAEAEARRIEDLKSKDRVP
ncbi:unnamed protein product [Symbiodinium sp. CCMP2592]|nr:unnamed protein product [Symbiodinium sp. CCMP2592]